MTYSVSAEEEHDDGHHNQQTARHSKEYPPSIANIENHAAFVVAAGAEETHPQDGLPRSAVG